MKSRNILKPSADAATAPADDMVDRIDTIIRERLASRQLTVDLANVLDKHIGRLHVRLETRLRAIDVKLDRILEDVAKK